MSPEQGGFPVTAEEIDLEMRRQLRRGAVVVLGCAAVPIALFVLLSVLGGWDLVGLVFIAMFAVPLAAPVDLIVRFPRPRAAVVDGAVELRGTRAPAVVVAVIGVLMAVGTFLLLAEDGIFEQRGGVVLLLSPPFGVALAVGFVMLAIWPLRVRVGPESVALIRGIGGRRSARLAWEEVEAVGIPAEAEGSGLRSLPVALQGVHEDLHVSSFVVAPTVWVLIEWLEHYRRHPEDRGELAGQAGLDRLSETHRRLSGRRRWPRWFPPPPETT